MTLFKQVALVVSMIIIIMLGSVMYINYESAKKSMIVSLYETTVNNISTLSSKLAEAGDDKAYIVTIIDSEFDSGYYNLIAYKSNNSDFRYTQVDNDTVEGVPLWFIENTRIELEKITTDISSGWSISGEITVSGDTGIVYKTLYKMFVKLLYLFAISVGASLVVLSILLHFVLKPLRNIQYQAEAILNNQFVIQKNEPYTKEFKEVVKGMNAMVKKVEDIFNKANEAAKRNQELLYKDPVTKLFNRRYLMLKLSDLIRLENKINGGVAIFMAFNSIEFINKSIGQQEAQKLLIAFAKDLNKLTKKYDDKVIARMNEREFTMILSSCEADEASDIVHRINRYFYKFISMHNIDASDFNISFGLYRYESSVKMEELLTKTDSALLNAIAKEDDNSYLYEEKDSKNALGKNQWHTILEESINNNNFNLKFWPTINIKTKNITHKVMTFTIITDDNDEYFFGDFIAPAINFGLVSKMFSVVIKDLLVNKSYKDSLDIYSIRLSNEFLKDVNSLNEVSEIFKKYAKSLKFKLLFEVSNNFAINNTELVKSFVNLFDKYAFGFGINSFTGESNDYTYLKELNPLFIKADSKYLLDQSEEAMSSFQVITDSLGIDVIATFVKSKEEVEKLSDKNVIIVQGPVTDMYI